MKLSTKWRLGPETLSGNSCRWRPIMLPCVAATAARSAAEPWKVCNSAVHQLSPAGFAVLTLPKKTTRRSAREVPTCGEIYRG